MSRDIISLLLLATIIILFIIRWKEKTYSQGIKWQIKFF